MPKAQELLELAATLRLAADQAGAMLEHQAHLDAAGEANMDERLERMGVGPQAGAGAVMARAQVPDALGRLEDRLERLDSLAEHLREVTGAVRSTGADSPGDAPPELDPMRAPLAVELDRLAWRADGIGNRLAAILDRVEL